MFHSDMDFHSLSRKELQALCKRNKIPANLTNIAMADALQSLEQVEGLDELNNAPKSDHQQSPEKSIPGSPELPPTASRTLTRTRRAPRRITNEENKNANLLETPAMPTSRRRAPATSTRKKTEAKVLVDAVMVTPVVQSSRRRAPAASCQGKIGAQEEGKSVQKVYGTRQSMRLLEKTMGELSLKGKGKVEAVKLENDVDENKADSGKGSEITHDSELYRNLDQSLENETEVGNGLQEENNNNNEYEVDACSQNWESGSKKSNNLDRLSGIDGEDVDSGNNADESEFQVENLEKANMGDGIVDENGSDVLNSVDSLEVALEPGSETDLNINQCTVPEETSAIAMEMEQASIDKAQDEVSAEIMDYILPAQSSAPSKIDNNPVTSYEVNLTDSLLSKPDENLIDENLSDEVEEYGKCSPLVCKVAPSDESECRKESENPQIFVENEFFDGNASDDVESEKSESCEESEDNLVEVDVTEKEEYDMSTDSAIKVAPKMQETVGSNENLIDVQATKAEELPSTLSKTPTSAKQMSPYQPLVAGETVHSPFAADTLQGQFPRPSGLAPKNTSAKTQITIEMMSHASIVNKENIDSSGMKVEPRKDEMKSTDKVISAELSLRELKKMLKKKLNISDKNNGEEIVQKEGRTRPALQRVPENGMVVAEAGTKN